MKDMELILGTAQFSGNYGITNSAYKYSEEELQAILKWALENGIVKIDTANSYPNVHQLLAKTLSKNNLLKDISIATKLEFRNRSPEEVRNLISGFRQLFSLNEIDVVFAHDWDDLSEKDFEVIKEVSQSFPSIRFGASTYDVSSVDQIVKLRPYISVVQLPLNVLNQSFLPTIPYLKSSGVEIWVRSAFLQGAIDWTSPLNRFRDHEAVEKLRALGSKLGASPFALALDFLKGSSCKVVVGVASKNQLIELFNLAKTPKLHIDYKDFASIDSHLTDPRLW